VASLGVRAPRALLAILVASLVVWPISWFSGLPIEGMAPGDWEWTMFSVKNVIVVVAPTVPSLGCVIWGWGRRARQRMGWFIYGILWVNVFWTLFYSFDSDRNALNIAIGVNALSLCISLPLRVLSMTKSGVALLRVEHGDMTLGFGTSLSWLVCYSVWNSLFSAWEFQADHSLQVILCWCMMVFYYYRTGGDVRIEECFAMARPIQLSCYMLFEGVLGFVFGGPPKISAVLGQRYLFFIASANLFFSVYVTLWEIYLLRRPDHDTFQRLRLLDGQSANATGPKDIEACADPAKPVREVGPVAG